MASNTLLQAAEQKLRDIIQDEIRAIELRRKWLNKSDLAPKRPEHIPFDPTVSDDAKLPPLEVTALALSGGGIRSASFCLGVLQAFNEHKCLPRIDYLSTVSGGGYIGTALTATMTTGQGDFVLGKSTRGEAGARPADVKDTPSMRHLRNYSNYLIPFGARDVLTALTIITRGLVANGTIVLAIALLLAAFTIQGSPTRTELFVPNLLHHPVAKLPFLHWLNEMYFGITRLLAVIGAVLFLGWALWRSWRDNPLRGVRRRGDDAEFRTWLPTLFAGYLLLIAFFVVTEFQPFVLNGMFNLADKARTSVDGDHSMATAFVQWFATLAAPVGAVVTFFRSQIATLFTSVTSSSRFTTKLLAAAASAAVWIGGAALPLLLWVGYLYLCFWGIENNGKPRIPEAPPPPVPAIHGTINIQGPGVDLHAAIKCGPGERDGCTQQPLAEHAKPGEYAHAPQWLVSAADLAAGFYHARVEPRIRPAGGYIDRLMRNPCVAWVLERMPSFFDRPITGLYTVAALVLLFLSCWLRPNANSLHQLYRDRLSKAFLFNPKASAEKYRSSVHSAIDEAFAPIGTKPLSELAQGTPYAPYHLINATLNVQGSDYANRRGRNSDFFLFSPFYVGSHATDYARTSDMERETNLDIATAMTISGAAFSPNAGAASIRALTPTLALLNVRTGYWLRNPRHVAAGRKSRWFDTNFYLWRELSGQLRETGNEIFLSDGGHVENLGVYELLRRRCRVIIVADAEADPALRYPSFITLQRYARIDLGARITMPWDGVRKTTLRWMGFTGDPKAPDKDAKSPAEEPKPSPGPHVAIGTIEYDGGHTGWLVYIKASLTGDENDYVRDYARRYDQFPHESTGDQFFSEEQFEVYRALGFHIANRLLSGADVAQVYDEEKYCVHLNIRANHPNVDPVRRALFAQ